MLVQNLTDNFQVTPERNVFKINIHLERFQKICRIAWNIFSAIVFPIGLVRLLVNFAGRLAVLPATYTCRSDQNQHLINIKNAMVQDPSNHLHQVKVTTADGVELDTLMRQNANQLNLPAAQQKWIVFFNPNAASYEDLIEELKEISVRTGANVYTGNYRGVMESKGRANSTHDMILDGEAMVQKLLASGVPSENILLHGWSIGGGVATEVAALHQEPGHEMHLCNDRSFATLTHAVKGLIPVVGGLLGGIAWLGGWKFDSVSNYRKINGYKFTIVAKNDHIIKYQASLHKVFKKSNPGATLKKIKIDVIGCKSSNHTISLPALGPQFDAYIDNIQEALQL